MAISYGDCELCLVCRDGPGAQCNTHHIWWPRRSYKSKLERVFRELPCQKMQVCIRRHRELHATTQPPRKPSAVTMRVAIEAHKKQDCFCKAPAFKGNSGHHRHAA